MLPSLVLPLLPIDMVPLQCKHPTPVQWGEQVKNSHHHQGDMSNRVITIRGTCLAWEEVCPQAKVVVPVWESATSGEDQDQLQLWTILISCNISGRRWTCPHLTSSGTSPVLAFATCRGSGGYVVLNICALRNITLFEGEDERGGFQGAGEACWEKVLCGTLLPH